MHGTKTGLFTKGHSPDRTNHFSSGTGDTENRHKEARLVSSGFVLALWPEWNIPTLDVNILHLIS